ncbi:hydrolase [Corynebacterium sp. 320]|uniref:NlpC/P60 family protein n=1 Tax=Corynebacterium TaxID=1716 RepID=UPI00125CB92F|nr:MULTISPECIES: NlpC/P60 family protein [Corynebacterium]KAB1502482.1 hydrolase [Corynebacterium sp. 320]KAB1551297.1 hydrolase [Corynebacterium sp. 321]KAB1551875.1 hydrolase [Corynebacterium sp. 319]KAB3526089.1 hydrolase [Corynebacterium sp. 250]KAB3538869.1 hydrolase [Corynebacterium sp. 366]
MKLNSALRTAAVVVALGSSATVLTIPAAGAQDVPAHAPATPGDRAAEIQALLDKPIPTDVDALLKHVGEVSRLAGETNDQVEALKVELAESQKRIEEANARIDEAQQRSDQRVAELEVSKGRVEDVSRALYNGGTASELSAISGSADPREAVEKTAYLESIANHNSFAIKAAEEDLKGIVDARNDAALARAKAQAEQRHVARQQAELESRSAQLEELKRTVMKAVDNLSPADRERWVAQNGPIDVNVDEFLSRLKAGGSPAASAYAQGVVGAALSKLGSPYSWGAAGPDAFDCSGLMYWSYQQQGKTIPRTSQAQLNGGQSVSRDSIQPGDIVAYYPGATHVGMYIGDGKIVHASDYGIPVQVVPLDSMPIVGISRY